MSGSIGQGVWDWRLQNHVILKVLAASVVTLIGTGAALSVAERTWTRSELLAITDKEARRLGYDVEHMSISFGWYKIDAWCQSDDKTWAVLYRPLKLSLGGDLCVVVDRDSGQVVGTKSGE